MVIGALITLLNGGKSKDSEVKEDSKPTYAHLFFIGDKIYSYNDMTLPCRMPLTIDNNPPSINIRFGSIQNHS